MRKSLMKRLDKIVETAERNDFTVTFQPMNDKLIAVTIDDRTKKIPLPIPFLWDIALIDDDELVLDFSTRVLDVVELLYEDSLVYESDRLHDLYESL